MQCEDVCRFMVVLWACWNGRNKAYHSDERVEPQIVLEKALSFWHSWRVAQPLRGDISNGTGVDRVVWRPPAIGEWKINVDAAVLGAMGSGFGVAVRDHTGKVERMGVLQVRDMCSSEIAVAKAAEFSLLTAKQMGLNNVVLESDSLVLITMLKMEKFQANYFGKIGKVVFDLASSFDCTSLVLLVETVMLWLMVWLILYRFHTRRGLGWDRPFMY
ncbi:uncharacterized protein LOC141632424 [Silene latifolia]|uniref:uncharacterized protein LOC141632424 n=1 Tax=Silene latifolia TaxID=37657 RepID=UPI003D76E915